MDTKSLEYSCTPLFSLKCASLISTRIFEQSDKIVIWKLTYGKGKGCKCFKKFDDYYDITCFRVGD